MERGKPLAILHYTSPVPSPTSPKPSNSRNRVHSTFRTTIESDGKRSTNEVVELYKTLRTVNKRVVVDKTNKFQNLIYDISLGLGITDTIIERSYDGYGLVDGTVIRDKIQLFYSINEIASGNYSVTLSIHETNQSWIVLVPINFQMIKIFHYSEIVNKLLRINGTISNIYYRVLNFDNVNNIIIMASKVILLGIKLRIVDNKVVSSSFDTELFNNQIKILFLRCQEIFIITIQCFIRKYLAKVKIRKLYQNYLKVFEGCRRAEMRNEIRKNQKMIVTTETETRKKNSNDFKTTPRTGGNNKLSTTTASVTILNNRMEGDDGHALPRSGRKAMHELIILQKGLEDLKSNVGGSMLSVRNEICKLKTDIQISKKQASLPPGSRNINASVDSLVSNSTILVDKFQDELNNIIQKVNYLDDRFNDSMKIISETSAKTSEVVEMVHNIDQVIRTNPRVRNQQSHEQHDGSEDTPAISSEFKNFNNMDSQDVSHVAKAVHGENGHSEEHHKKGHRHHRRHRHHHRHHEHEEQSHDDVEEISPNSNNTEI